MATAAPGLIAGSTRDTHGRVRSMIPSEEDSAASTYEKRHQQTDDVEYLMGEPFSRGSSLERAR